MTTKSNAAVTLVTGHKYEIIPTSAVRRLVSYPTHYLLVVHDAHNQPESYILDATAFAEAYAAEYGRSEDEAAQRSYIAVALYRAVTEGGKTFKVLGQGTAESLTTE